MTELAELIEEKIAFVKAAFGGALKSFDIISPNARMAPEYIGPDDMIAQGLLSFAKYFNTITEVKSIDETYVQDMKGQLEIAFLNDPILKEFVSYRHMQLTDGFAWVRDHLTGAEFTGAMKLIREFTNRAEAAQGRKLSEAELFK